MPLPANPEAIERTIECAYRVRVMPKPAQQRQLSRLFGARRYVWNWALKHKYNAYKADGTKLNAIALSREFTETSDLCPFLPDQQQRFAQH